MAERAGATISTVKSAHDVMISQPKAVVALITKAHHCMIDGVGSVELTGSVMRPTPDPDPRLAGPATYTANAPKRSPSSSQGWRRRYSSAEIPGKVTALRTTPSFK